MLFEINRINGKYLGAKQCVVQPDKRLHNRSDLCWSFTTDTKRNDLYEWRSGK